MPEMRLNAPLKSLLLLAGALAACLGLLALRFLFTGHFSYPFLVRNLFLGLIPLGIALVALAIERQNWRFWGRSLLVVFSILAFLASAAHATHWQVLRAFRFCGICTLLFSLTFCLLSGLEAFKPERQKRTIIAALLFLAATLLCLSQIHIVTEPAD